MKLNQIALVVAAMVATPAAFALTPSQVAGATQLWMTGAATFNDPLFDPFLDLCQGVSYLDPLGFMITNPGPLDAHIYRESLLGERGAYACTVVDTPEDRYGALEGTKVVLYHTVEGGSLNAYTPALRLAGEINPNLPTTLRRITEVADLDDAPSQCAAGAPAGLYRGIPYYIGCQTTGVTLATKNPVTGVITPAIVPASDAGPTNSIGGFSETEYLMNKLNLGLVTDLTTIGGEVPTNIGQVFGAAVSWPLYSQLQKNQDIISTIGGTDDDCDVANTTGISFASGACQPNLPASLYTTVANAATTPGVTPAMFGVAAFPGTAGKLQFHRRAITSGTQSASNIRFLNTPCATGEPQGALSPARSIANGGANFPGVIVTENSSTGGVRTGLNNAANAVLAGVGEFGMGWLSMENIPLSSDQWAIVKLDGIAPNTDAQQRATAMEGSYSAFYELVVFTAADASPEGFALIAAVNTSLANPSITDLPGLFITPLAGVTGINVGKVYREGNSCRPAAQ